MSDITFNVIKSDPQKRNRTDTLTARLKSLQLGECLEIRGEGINVANMRSHTSSCAKVNGMTFTVRLADGGLNIYRTA